MEEPARRPSLLARDDSSPNLAHDPRLAATSPASSTPFDLAALEQYLHKLIALVFNARPSELDSLFATPHFAQTATKWATDPTVMGVYLVKERLERAAIDHTDDNDRDMHDQAAHQQREQEQTDALVDDSLDDSFRYSLTTALAHSPNEAATLTLIKHVSTLDTTQPIASQLHFMNTYGPAERGRPSSGATGATSGPGVYEGLHRLVHYGVAPAFEAFVSSKGKKEGVRRRGDESKEADSKMGIPMTKKKFAELELSLLHRQSLSDPG